MAEAAYTYIIVGAGAAGCVLAYRLSEDPAVSVLVIEAGGRDHHPFFQVPKAVPKLMARAKSLWAYPTETGECTANKVETWVRGRVVGGSTSINGLMYVRGQPADFDAIAELSSDDWSWPHIGAAYAALEGHELGAQDTRGGHGPLKLSLPGKDVRGPWHAAVIEAGRSMGLPVKADVNVPDDGEGVGYNPRNIWKGRRQSAATAFLKPAERRPNVTVVTDAVVETLAMEGQRVTAVRYRQSGRGREAHATRDIILAAGALATPGILERSGIGDPRVLEPLGIEVRHALPAVGANLLEHRALLVQWRLKSDRYSFNRNQRGWRLAWEVVRYALTRKGPLSSATFDMGVWMKSRPGLNRPDTQLLVAPHSVDFSKMGQTTEPFPGMSVVLYALRPTSAGSIHITTIDPEAPPKLTPNHRETEEDRQAMIEGLRACRRFAEQPALKEIIVEETNPGPKYQTNEELLQAYDVFATCGYHAVGSCRMGKDAGSVVDPQLRVRGLKGLRIMDTSVMPVVPAGNTQAPTMAMAWRAADVIRRDP